MAIQDVLTTIKDYFIDWHGEWKPNANDNYEKTHRLTDQITNVAPESEYSIRSKAIVPFKTATENDINNIKTRLTNVENNKYPFLAQDPWSNNVYARVGGTNGIKSYQADWRGFNPVATGDCHDGLMRWQDKAQLIELGTWYERTRTEHRSLGEHMTLWVNPAIRICYLKFAHPGFKVSQWDNINSDSAEWDWYSNSSDHFLDNCAPIYNIWAPTNHPYIMIGMDKTARFYIRSSKKITKDLGIYGSLFWFYRDDTFLKTTTSATRWKKE